MNSLFRNESGSVAVKFVLVLMPALLATGAAVDFTRGSLAKTHLQVALDAGALSAATAPVPASDAERVALAEQVFHANFDGTVAGASATPQFAINEQTVTGSASFTFESTFMQVGHVMSMEVGASTEVTIPSFGMTETVFVLDYSSSMNDQYDEMRDAAITLIDTMTVNRTRDDVKIGLVPFAKQVYATLPGDFVLGGTPGVPWSNCTVGRKWPWVWKDHVPTAAAGSKWGRNDGDDDIDADEYDDCDDLLDNSLVIRPLTIDHAGTVAQLNAMTPDSGTNIALGLEFGFHLLSPGLPWSEGVAYDDPEWRKTLVLLSDGRHNKPGFGPGNRYTSSQGRENMELLCDEMKERDIMIITIAYDLDDNTGKQELRDCASSGRHYLEGDIDSIASVFRKVGSLIVEDAFISR